MQATLRARQVVRAVCLCRFFCEKRHSLHVGRPLEFLQGIFYCVRCYWTLSLVGMWHFYIADAVETGEKKRHTPAKEVRATNLNIPPVPAPRRDSQQTAGWLRT